jgi:hypothetical protein
MQSVITYHQENLTAKAHRTFGSQANKDREKNEEG